MRYDVDVLGRRRQMQVTRVDGRFEVEIDGRRWSIDAVRVDGHTLSLLMNRTDGRAAKGSGGRSEEIVLAPNLGTGTLVVGVAGVAVDVDPNTRRRARTGEGASQTGPQRLLAPMPGKVVRVLVAPGDDVGARQPIVVVEAMKMENELRASRPGRVVAIAVRDGQLVDAGALLAIIADS